VDGRVVAKTDPVFQGGRLTGIDMHAAQILDVALSADDYLLVVRAEYRPVPDGGGTAKRYPADHDGAGCDPRLRVDGRDIGTESAD